MVYRTTFALDEATRQRLRKLASRWNVSQAEVVRRSIERADEASGSESLLQVLRSCPGDLTELDLERSSDVPRQIPL